MAENKVHKLHEADKILKEYGLDVVSDDKARDDFFGFFGSFAGEDVAISSEELDDEVTARAAFPYILRSMNPDEIMENEDYRAERDSTPSRRDELAAYMIMKNEDYRAEREVMTSRRDKLAAYMEQSGLIKKVTSAGSSFYMLTEKGQEMYNRLAALRLFDEAEDQWGWMQHPID